jgi:RNA polymerase sigma factor (sigma-70 family)
MAGRTELSEDTEFGVRLLEDDQACLEDILRAFGAGILGLLRRQFRDALREEDLEDVLLIGLFRLWKSRQQYEQRRASLRVWLYRICENAARDVLRMGWQKARSREVSSDSPLADVAELRSASSVNAIDAVSLEESPPTAIHHDLKEVLGELPEVQRMILMADAAARDVVACSQRLGEELGLPASTVRVYRKRAMDRVRRELLARGYGEMNGISHEQS